VDKGKLGYKKESSETIGAGVLVLIRGFIWVRKIESNK
jgi:hypothetical protein